MLQDGNDVSLPNNLDELKHFALEITSLYFVRLPLGRRSKVVAYHHVHQLLE